MERTEKDGKGKALVIIPAYNEEKNIGSVVSAIRKLSFHPDIIVVDDGSVDHTADNAQAAGAIVISLPFNLGYGAALQTGFKYSVRKGYDYAVQMDADSQHEAASILDLKSAIEKDVADVIIGSRFLEDPDYPLGFARRAGLAIFRIIVSIITAQQVTDPTSGFRALNRRALELYCGMYPSDFPDADIIIATYLSGLRIAEIPVKIYPNHFGKSMHSGFKPFYYIYKMFLSMLVTMLRRYPEKRP
jgi:glycosyltransferase involved in cell wall biosynthesis